MIARDWDSDTNGFFESRHYVLQDATFNVTGVITSAGVVVERPIYDAFGAQTIHDAAWNVIAGSTVQFVHGHQGLRFDFTIGQHDNRWRWYSARLMRFVSVDPILFGGNTSNFYSYMNNGPLSAVDPYGQRPWGAASRFTGTSPKFFKCCCCVEDMDYSRLQSHKGAIENLVGDFFVMIHHITITVAWHGSTEYKDCTLQWQEGTNVQKANGGWGLARVNPRDTPFDQMQMDEQLNQQPANPPRQAEWAERFTGTATLNDTTGKLDPGYEARLRIRVIVTSRCAPGKCKSRSRSIDIHQTIPGNPIGGIQGPRAPMSADITYGVQGIGQ